MSRYIRIASRFWQDEKTTKLNDDEKLLMLYILTSPHSNMIGFYVLPILYACHDLDWEKERFNKSLNRLLDKEFIYYDDITSTVLIPNFLRYNPIQNVNQAKGAIKAAEEIPNNSLFTTFFECICEHVEVYKELFSKRFNKQLHKPFTKPLDKPNTIRYTNTETETETETETKTELIHMCASSAHESDSKSDGAQSLKTGKGNKAPAEKSDAEYTDEFETFWSFYPRQLEKKAAYKAWKARLKQKEDSHNMIMAAKHYALHCQEQGIEERFIKHAKTFLGATKPYEEYIRGAPVPTKTSNDIPKAYDSLKQWAEG